MSAGEVRRTVATRAAEPGSNGRIVRYVFSEPSVARDGHTIAADAWMLDGFRASPVFLWAHDQELPPIGRVVEIGTVGDRLVGNVKYAEFEFADLIYQLVRGGFVNAVSTSWLPIEWKFSTDPARRGGIDFRKVDLLEISQVPVPALPTALVTARSSGINTGPLYEWAEKLLDRGDAILVPRGEIEELRRAAKMPTRNTTVISDIRPIAPNARAFGSLGEYMVMVARATIADTVDPRLVRAPAGAGEGDPIGGGFLVPTQFAEELVGFAYEQAVIAPLCDRRQTSGPLADVKLPGIDETSRVDGSRHGGSLAYWIGEGTAVPSTLPRFKQLNFSGKKLMALIYGTNELLEDAPLLGAHLRKVLGAEMGFQLDRTVLSGTGAGVPQGILNSSSLITIPKAAGQTPASILGINVTEMWKCLPLPSRRRAVWLVSEDAENALDEMNAGNRNAGLYMPAGWHGNVDPTLKGRPVLAIEQCSALGSVGDIVLADLSHYIIIDGGMKPMLSVHFRFDNDQATWRFVLRVDGQSAFASPITPFKGSTLRSPFVALANR